MKGQFKIFCPCFNSDCFYFLINMYYFFTHFFIFFRFWKLFLLAVLDLRCFVQTFSSCSEQGLPFVLVCGLLIAVAYLVAEHRLQTCGLSGCSLEALEHRISISGTWA